MAAALLSACRFGERRTEGLPPPLPPELLERYGHPPRRYSRPAELHSVVTSTAGEGEGRAEAAGESIRDSLRHKYSHLGSSSRGGSGGRSSASFAAAAAAALAATGLGSGSVGSSFKGDQQQQPMPAPLITIPESDSGRASSSGGGDTGKHAAAGMEPGNASDGPAGQQKQQPAHSASPSKYQKQLSAAVAAAVRAAGGEPAPHGATQAAQSGSAPAGRSPSLLARLLSLLPGTRTAGGGAAGGGPAGRGLYQAPSFPSARSRSLLRMLSSRQLSRVSPQGQDERPGGTPPSLQQQAAAAAERLRRRPPTLQPGGEPQREQARLLAAAQEHLRRMQAAGDEAAMQAERRQVGCPPLPPRES